MEKDRSLAQCWCMLIVVVACKCIMQEYFDQGRC